MAVDLGLMGKLLALSRSHEPAEAALATARFVSLLGRWCREQGLPDGTGYVTLAEPDNAACKLAETLAQYCEVRVLALEPFELIAVGSELDCRWIYWWFSQTYGEIEKTARRANFKERHLFMHGAILGIAQSISWGAHSPERKEKRAVERDRPRENPKKEEGGQAAVQPPPPLAAPQRSVLNDGLIYGSTLARRLALIRPPLPIRGGSRETPQTPSQP